MTESYTQHPITSQERQRRHWAVKQALAIVTLEGQSPGAHCQELMSKYADGHLTQEQLDKKLDAAIHKDLEALRQT